VKTLFRADSSSKIGLGHIMRDLVLADQFSKNGDEVFFATQNLEGNINYKIPFQVEIVENNSIEELLKVIDRLEIERVVFDHYEIDYSFEKELKNSRDIEIWSFDDTYERHYSNVIYNHNISAKPEKYKNIVPDFCQIKAGPKYTLIREEFLKAKRKFRWKNRDKMKTIFLAMGGADTSNISLKIIKLIPKNIKVNLVTTSANQNLKSLKKEAFLHKNIKLHINTNKMAEIMANSDFSIVTPSVILHEVLFMEIPFLAIRTEKNQDDIYKYLKRNRYPVLGNFSKTKFQNILRGNL
jgi:UDP-2,4-diacetamido-2,4,6-trideoxy-beta-L-altropyranose hydrolase